MILARKPRKLPSLSSASSAVVTLSRACASQTKTFRARRHPFHRPAGDFGRAQHQRHFVIDGGFHAETAADIAADDADLAVRDFQNILRQFGLKYVGPLQGRVDRVAALDRLEHADAAARLHRRRGDAVDDEVMLDDVGGAGKGCVGRFLVALDLDEADIVGAIVPNQRHAGLHGITGRNSGRQRLVIDFDQFRRIGRLIKIFRNDEGDIVADHAHAVLDQRRIARLVAGRAVAALEPAGHRQVTEARRLVIGAGQHREHAGRRLRFRGVDRTDARMGVRRAQHDAMSHAGKGHVGDIAAVALDQARVLEAGNGLADCKFTHRIPRLRCCGAGPSIRAVAPVKGTLKDLPGACP